MFDSVVQAVLHYADTFPARFCLADDQMAYTYRQYADRILSYAACFAGTGILPDTRVVVEANQTVDYLAIQAALQLIGAVFVPVEHNCAAEKIRSVVERAKAAVMITNHSIAEEQNCLRYSYERLNEMANELPPYTMAGLPPADRVSEILFSTGTTGKEKGIVLTHRNNIALAENVIGGVEMAADNIEMIPSPLNHSHGLRRYYANMVNGSGVVLLGSVMNMARFFDNLDRYGVNSIDLVPSALAVVLRLSKGRLADYADQLRYIQFGSAPLAEQDVTEICRQLPRTRMYNFYGSTESGCSMIYNFNCPSPKKNCIGRPTCNTVVLMVDDNRQQMIPTQETPGAIATAGGMNMLGYWEDPEETARAMAEGVVYSNDMGYFDQDGDLILMGRKGDVINVGGSKVSPDEIENAAKKMPMILDCGCVGIPDPAKGQVPKLVVQLKLDAPFEPKEIRAFLATLLEPYKLPAVIEQREKIPRTFNGKLSRKDL